MSTYSEYGTDRQKEEEGVWVPMADGSEWLIARGSSARSRKALRRAQAKFRGQMQRAERLGQELPEDIQDEINMRWSSNGLVLGWRKGKSGVTVTDKDGADLEFNKENLVTVLTDLPDLFGEVVQAAGNVSLYKDELDEEAVKN